MTIAELPGRYFRLLEAGCARVEEGLLAAPDASLETLEQRPGWRHFPSSILMAAVLATKPHPANPRQGDARLLALALRIGDLLAAEHAQGRYATRLDHHRDTYHWLEAFRLLESQLGEERRIRWRQALLDNLTPLAAMVAARQEYPRYQAPFIGTSPNHYSLWASTLLLGGRVFGNAEWEQLGGRVMHRFAAEEQAPDGYWGEHSNAGPTTGYDTLTVAAVALYDELSQDPAALEALRRSTDFHKHYTYPDGTPVETINDRNRHWEVPMWGHFGFSHFPDGRRYAAFLTGFFPEDGGDLESLGRIAQNALYFHEGETAPIPQEEARSAHRMTVPAGIRKTGPWTVCLSGLIDTQAAANQFFLDRQGSLSIFHEASGLIVTGANSKRQPELATFSENVGGQITHLPLSSHLQMSEERDRLALAFNTFFATLEVPAPSEERLEFRFAVTYKWGRADAALTLQLALKAGQPLDTGAGRKAALDAAEIAWGDGEVGGWIRHNGWTLRLPEGARLAWPVYPFNPYRNDPETALEWAVGTVSVPLRAEDQEIAFVLERER